MAADCDESDSLIHMNNDKNTELSALLWLFSITFLLCEDLDDNEEKKGICL